MHCFWTGEMKLGQLKGVLETEAGFIGGHEVTLVIPSAIINFYSLRSSGWDF